MREESKASKKSPSSPSQQWEEEERKAKSVRVPRLPSSLKCTRCFMSCSRYSVPACVSCSTHKKYAKSKMRELEILLTKSSRPFSVLHVFLTQQRICQLVPQVPSPSWSWAPVACVWVREGSKG